MYNTNELREVLDDAEMAYISAEFWQHHRPVLGKMNPDHPVWKELNAFQNGWLACKNFYKINT